MTSPLLPCPFCSQIPTFDYEVKVQFYGCAESIPIVFCRNRECRERVAIERWNDLCSSDSAEDKLKIVRLTLLNERLVEELKRCEKRLSRHFPIDQSLVPNMLKDVRKVLSLVEEE